MPRPWMSLKRPDDPGEYSYLKPNPERQTINPMVAINSLRPKFRPVLARFLAAAPAFVRYALKPRG